MASKRGPIGPPKTKDRGPTSKEDTQTDFAAMNVLGATPTPTTAIDACAHDGFALNSGLKIAGSGVLLVGGDAFNWKPWISEGRKEGTIGEGALGDDNKGVSSVGGTLRNKKGQWEVAEHSWGLLDAVWPKPGEFEEDPFILQVPQYLQPTDAAPRSPYPGYWSLNRPRLA
jgi:NADH dehydrogenase [ubiquinone] 1 alpha subcomplex assembly factor 3